MNVISYPSPNFDARPGGILPDMLVLHYTDMRTSESALERMTDPKSQVSAHYLINDVGKIYALVPLEERAWHAGVSNWRRRVGINAYSIGIELDNPGHSNGYRPFYSAQVSALIALIHDIMGRYKITPQMIVGHSDIAPLRKKDPGELFPWEQLAADGIGFYPPNSHIPMAPEVAEEALRAIGYAFDDCEIASAVYAFQRRFLPKNLTGQMDMKTCSRIGDIATAYM